MNVRKELLKVRRQLIRRHIYPSWHPADSWVQVECSSRYYDLSEIHFINVPRNEYEWKLAERYAMLSHADMCPRPEDCPTCLKLREEE
jgi:hypothetical protein